MKCRLCGETDLQEIIDLGQMSLSNSFLDHPDSPEETYPLCLYFCPECSLVQISETIPPTTLFSQYNYFSSMSREMIDHVRDLANSIIVSQHLNNNSRIVEIASNDGYFLKCFQKVGLMNVIGIDPARNVVDKARENGVPTICDFFGEKLGEEMKDSADVIIALNVLGHVPDLNGFVRGIRVALKSTGVAVIEVPSVKEMVDSLALDTVYFEHLNYWSLTSLTNLFKWNGLQIVRAENVPIHCGSLRIYVTHLNPFPPSDRYGVAKILRLERQLGVDRIEYYRNTSANFEKSITRARNFLLDLKSHSKHIVCYGAAAKGVQMLNYMGISADTVDYVVDSTPIKQGRYLPGSHIKVVSPEQLGNPDVIVVLAWNWISEIRSKHPDFKGQWATLLPTPRFVGLGEDILYKTPLPYYNYDTAFEIQKEISLG